LGILIARFNSTVFWVSTVKSTVGDRIFKMQEEKRKLVKRGPDIGPSRGVRRLILNQLSFLFGVGANYAFSIDVPISCRQWTVSIVDNCFPTRIRFASNLPKFCFHASSRYPGQWNVGAEAQKDGGKNSFPTSHIVLQ
jgi:hypothetical protein